MKKIFSVLLVITLCFSVLPISAFAQNDVNDYVDDEKEFIVLKYANNEHMLDTLFGSDTAIAYWSMVNDTEENGFLKWSIEKASQIIGEYPDKQDYAEILANLIMMQSGDIAEQVQSQSQYDDLKDGFDYAMDIVDIAADFVGGAKLLETISPIIDVATGGAEIIIDNVEQAKYYETSIRDYAQSKLFLEAVHNYAENEELRSAASSLLVANDKLLESRLEYLSSSAATLADYEAEFFVENLSFALLKTADIYQSDETVKWYVDCGEKLSDSIGAILSAGTYAFHMTMLAGNIGFGTSDTFNRYQEMKIVSDVAGAIVKANSQIVIPKNAGADSVLTDIQTKCDYYKMLISTHARGEYLIYQLLVNDAGLLSDFRVLFDCFKEPGETTDSWYARQIGCMTDYYDILEGMFEASDDDVPHGDEADVPDTLNGREDWDIDAELPETFFSITSSLRVGWEIMLQNDGSFDSVLKNPDWGSQGEAYPNGTCYIAKRSGKFTSLEKVNDTTYKIIVDEIGYTEQEGQTYIEDGIRYIVENELPIDSGDVFYLYLPGTLHSDFPQGLVDSVNNNGRYSMDDITPTSYVLYHPDAESAGYELVFISEPDDNAMEKSIRETARNIDMASTLGYSKVWEIYDNSGPNPWVTALAFQENGIFCCGIGLPMSEWSLMFQGNYEIEGDKIIFHYAINGEKKETTYQTLWTDKVFRQISEENLVIDHPTGTEYHFEESTDLTAAGLFYQLELFKSGPLEGWD